MNIWRLALRAALTGWVLAVLLAGCVRAGEEADFGYVESIGTRAKQISFAIWGDPQVAYYEKGTKFDSRKFKPRFEEVNPRFQQVVELTNELKPEFVVTVGDNIHGFGEWECFRTLVDLARPLRMPLYMLMGNHDHIPRADRYPSNPYKERPFGNFLWAQKQLGAPERIAYSFDAGEWHLVLFSQPGNVDEFMRERPELLEWLDADLRANRERPTMFFTHHPLLPVGRFLFESYGPHAKVRAELMDILTRYGNVKYVFTGHVHPTVSAVPSISWRYRGASFIVMPNSAHWARTHYYQESYRSSQGVGLVRLNGKRCESLVFHTLAGEKVSFATGEFPVYDDDVYAYLRPKEALPAGPALVNGGFEEPLSEGWFVNHLMPYDTPPIQRRLLKTSGAPEGERYLYLYTKSREGEGKYAANFLLAEVRQAVSVASATGWPQLRLKYKMDSGEYVNPSDCNAFVAVSGHRREAERALFNLVYSLGRFLRLPDEGPPYVGLMAAPELDRWSDLMLNVRSDYETYFPERSWEGLKLESLVVRLAVFNDNSAREGRPAEIGVGFDAVSWSVLEEPAGPSPGFTAP